MKGFKENIKREDWTTMDIPIKGRPSKNKNKKQKKGWLLCSRTHTDAKKKKSSFRHFRLSNPDWGGEKASPSFLFRLPPNQNLKNAEKPKKRQVCPCNAYTTRAPSACASKLLYPQNGGVGAWAIHIWWIALFFQNFPAQVDILCKTFCSDIPPASSVTN